MKKALNLLVFTILWTTMSMAQGYEIGSLASDFTLKNIDDSMVSLHDYADEKGVIVIFTCNHCPFSVAYEDRIIALDKKYKELGYPVVAINPNDAELYPSDSFSEMKIRAEEKKFTFPYLVDTEQAVYPRFGATKTPHVYVLQQNDGAFEVVYIGTIDNSARDEDQVSVTYLADALDALIAGKVPEVQVTKAIGCSIKTKKK